MPTNSKEAMRSREENVAGLLAMLSAEKSNHSIRYFTQDGRSIGVDDSGINLTEVEAAEANHDTELALAFEQNETRNGRHGILFEAFMRFVLAKAFDAKVTLSPGFLDFSNPLQKAMGFDAADIVIAEPTEVEGVDRPLLMIDLKIQRTSSRPAPIHGAIGCPLVQVTGDDLFSVDGANELLRIFQSAVDPMKYAKDVGTKVKSEVLGYIESIQNAQGARQSPKEPPMKNSTLSDRLNSGYYDTY